MNSLQKLTRHIPKYLFVFFVAIIVFNIVTYFFYPGIKEGHKSSNKKIKKLDEKIKKLDEKTKNLDEKTKRSVKQLKRGVYNMIDPHGRTLKKGSDVKPSDWVSVASDDMKNRYLGERSIGYTKSIFPQLF
jgi:hypothetical protein